MDWMFAPTGQAPGRRLWVDEILLVKLLELALDLFDPKPEIIALMFGTICPIDEIVALMGENLISDLFIQIQTWNILVRDRLIRQELVRPSAPEAKGLVAVVLDVGFDDNDDLLGSSFRDSVQRLTLQAIRRWS
jgi:hypothetical protein